jgi:hypothetical protein
VHNLLKIGSSRKRRMQLGISRNAFNWVQCSHINRDIGVDSLNSYAFMVNQMSGTSKTNIDKRVFFVDAPFDFGLIY